MGVWVRSLFLLFTLLPTAIFADEARIAVGMNHDEVVALIKKYGGENITPGQEILPRRGWSTPTGLYWAFHDYDVVIELVDMDGKVRKILFWTKKDFNESKVHRAGTEQSITALKFDTKTKEVSVEKQKVAD